MKIPYKAVDSILLFAVMFLACVFINGSCSTIQASNRGLDFERKSGNKVRV